MVSAVGVWRGALGGQNSICTAAKCLEKEILALWPSRSGPSWEKAAQLKCNGDHGRGPSRCPKGKEDDAGDHPRVAGFSTETKRLHHSPCMPWGFGFLNTLLTNPAATSQRYQGWGCCPSQDTLTYACKPCTSHFMYTGFHHCNHHCPACDYAKGFLFVQNNISLGRGVRRGCVEQGNGKGLLVTMSLCWERIDNTEKSYPSSSYISMSLLLLWG